MKHTITLFRYLALLGVGVETYGVMQNQIITEGWVIAFLLYAINFQVRYFNYPNKKVRFFSLLLDLVFISLIYVRFEFLTLFAVTIFVFDSWQQRQRKLAFVQFLLLVLLMFALAGSAGVHYNLFDFIYLLLIALVSDALSVYKYQNQDLEAENIQMQHQLNELEKNKDTMEQYMGTMRELYTLKERNRLSRELHDSVGHSLSTIIIQLAAITSLAKNDAAAAAQMSDSLRNFASKSMKEVREQLAEMKPEQFARNQVFMAIDEMMADYQQHTGIQVNFGMSDQEWLLSEKQELLLYRAIQEFLSNSAKYAEATRINIFLHFNQADMILTMKDNGRGTEKVVPHLGLLSVEERINEAKGELKITTAPGNGFQMQVMLTPEKRNVYAAN